MKAKQTIQFTVETREGKVATYMADDKVNMILMIAAIKKFYGAGQVRVVKGSIKVSKVLVIGNTVVSKAG